MYSSFQFIFEKFNGLGVSTFTGGFLFIQLTVFLFLMFLTGRKIWVETTVMRNVKQKIIDWERPSDQQASALLIKLNQVMNEQKKSAFTEQWDRYYQRVSQKNEDERIRTEPFIGGDVLLYKMGSRPVMDAGAGICVSLGVLGTFVGLAMGLDGLSMGNTEQLRQGIDGLLSGMKVAFYTSVWGVVLSLGWTAYDRAITKRLEVEVDWHAERLDYLLNADDEELFLNRLEKISRTQADHLKTILTDALEKAMQPIVTQFQHSHGHVREAFSQLDQRFSQFQQGIEKQTGMLESQIEWSKQNSHNITDRLVEQITGGTEQSLSQFGDIIRDTQNMQQHMMGTIEQVVQSFAVTEQKQANMIKSTEEMFNQFAAVSKELEYMQSSYKDTSVYMNQLGSTIQQIQALSVDQLPIQTEMMRSNQQLAEKYEKVTEGFAAFHQTIEQKHNDMLKELITFSAQMADTYRSMTGRFDEALNKQIHTLRESDALLNSVTDIVHTLTPLAPGLQEAIHQLTRLQEQVAQAQEAQNKLLPELVEMKKQTNDTITNALHKTSTYMEQMQMQIETMSSQWAITQTDFAETRQALHTSLRDFSENIDAGLSKTYEHFDKTLTNAVSKVSSLVNEFTDRQEDLMEVFDDLYSAIQMSKEVTQK